VIATEPSGSDWPGPEAIAQERAVALALEMGGTRDERPDGHRHSSLSGLVAEHARAVAAAFDLDHKGFCERGSGAAPIPEGAGLSFGDFVSVAVGLLASRRSARALGL
jgi:hypothetical protein